MRGLHPFVLRIGPADLESALHRSAATGVPVGTHEIGLRAYRAKAITKLRRQRRRGGAEAGNVVRHRLIGQGVDTSILHPVVLATVTYLLAAVQLANDLNRLGEHFPANPRRRPALGRHMLVESLARADTQHASSFTLHRVGRSRLRHDGRVNPDQWARYRSGDRQRSRLTER